MLKEGEIIKKFTYSTISFTLTANNKKKTSKKYANIMIDKTLTQLLKHISRDLKGTISGNVNGRA